MNSQGNDKIYRVAFDAANAQLTEISAEFERLRLRKEQVERLVGALKPVIGEELSPAPEATFVNETPIVNETVAEAPKEEKPQRLGVGADPFQRRVDHVLGIGAGIRDVRQYTRQF